MRTLRRRVLENDVEKWSAEFLRVLTNSRSGRGRKGSAA
jgi:hypothetical protein